MSPATTADPRAAFSLAAMSPSVHFEACAKIKDARTKAFFRPTANVLQRRIQEAYEVLSAYGYPAIRIIVTKIRQCGGTTVSQHIVYHKCKRENTDALVIADTVPRARMVLERFREFDAQDKFPWQNPLVAQATNMQWLNGSTATITSAESRNPGIAAPRQAILFSESCKYPRGGVVDDKDIVASVMPSLNDAGLAIAESTPEGASGWHYDTWQGALNLDEFIKALKAGEHRPGNGWVKVFAAWFEFEDNQHPVTDKMRDQINRTLTNRERNGIDKYGWTHEQIYWRRATIQGECGGSADLCDEYYPEDEVSCFLSSGRPRFNMASVLKLEKQAQLATKEIGTLTEQDGSGVVQFVPDPQGMASFHLWERPRAGCRYLVWCDPATGEDQTESNDPDRHSIGVLRCGYTDDRGATFPDAVVARVRPPFTGNTLLAADFITLLSRYYGNAIVVLEINMGLHILERLKEEGIPIYQRQVIDPYERETQKMMYGWKLKDRDQRRTVVDCLALAIHEESIKLNCPHIASECRTFIIDKNGKEISRSGCKDDDVLGLAMALFCKGSGTLYREPTRRRRLPADHRKWR